MENFLKLRYDSIIVEPLNTIREIYNTVSTSPYAIPGMIIAGLASIHFVIYELPYILDRRETKKRAKEGDLEALMLTGHVSGTIDRKGNVGYKII